MRETAGFFTYDPQTGTAFDPKRSDFQNHSEYERIVKDIPNIVALASQPSRDSDSGEKRIPVGRWRPREGAILRLSL
jgi:hypothetical protein